MNDQAEAIIIRPAGPRVIDWLMQGDPAIQWQTMRDVLGKPRAKWKPVRQRVASEGWGGRLLGVRDSAGTWGGGIYSPKWTSTTYTLLLLRDMGLPRETPAGGNGAALLADRFFGPMADEGFAQRLAKLDLCIAGMCLSLLAYFGVQDSRAMPLVEQLLAQQMADGGWNCVYRRRPVRHSSLHTTMNVLDGLADYAEHCRAKAAFAVNDAIRCAHEFILDHRLFRSDKTGEVIRPEFTKFSFPPRWHWDVLRGLDHFRRMNGPRDPRLNDAIDLLRSRQSKDGCWKLQHHYGGREFFRMESPGQPSRWNTLRALRVLRWWGHGVV